MTDLSEMVSVRYMVDDVEKAVDFYTAFLDFKVLNSFVPAFADVARGRLRLPSAQPPLRRVTTWNDARWASTG